MGQGRQCFNSSTTHSWCIYTAPEHFVAMDQPECGESVQRYADLQTQNSTVDVHSLVQSTLTHHSYIASVGCTLTLISMASTLFEDSYICTVEGTADSECTASACTSMHHMHAAQRASTVLSFGQPKSPFSLQIGACPAWCPATGRPK